MKYLIFIIFIKNFLTVISSSFFPVKGLCTPQTCTINDKVCHSNKVGTKPCDTLFNFCKPRCTRWTWDSDEDARAHGRDSIDIDETYAALSGDQVANCAYFAYKGYCNYESISLGQSPYPTDWEDGTNHMEKNKCYCYTSANSPYVPGHKVCKSSCNGGPTVEDRHFQTDTIKGVCPFGTFFKKWHTFDKCYTCPSGKYIESTIHNQGWIPSEAYVFYDAQYPSGRPVWTTDCKTCNGKVILIPTIHAYAIDVESGQNDYNMGLGKKHAEAFYYFAKEPTKKGYDPNTKIQWIQIPSFYYACITDSNIDEFIYSDISDFLKRGNKTDSKR